MKITVQPQDDYQCLQKLINKEQGANIDELIIIPQDRIGFSGANLYLYYYKTKSIKQYYSAPFFFKIANKKEAKILTDEVDAYKKHVAGYLKNSQRIIGPEKTIISGVEYVYISSPAVGSESTQVPIKDFKDLSVVTIESLIKENELHKTKDWDKYKRKINNSLLFTFNTILKSWIGNYNNFKPSDRYEDKESLKEFMWAEEYEWYLRWDRSEKKLANLLAKNSSHNFIYLHESKFINPLKYLKEQVLNKKFTGKARVIHGDLHLRNIMVNQSLDKDEVYLIDFGWTKDHSHCLKDYCLLEFSLKFIHLTKQLTDLEIIAFEEALLKEEFPDRLNIGSCRFIFDLIIEIRNQSKKECKENSWKHEYLTSLLLITTGSLGIKVFQGLDTRAVLTSITWICQKLHLEHSSEKLLSDLGETQILDKYILEKFNKELENYPNIVIPLGDDCTGIQISIPDNLLITSSDPCPLPIAWLLGDRDYYHYGWYSLLINLSDIASMGAKPTGILLSCIMNENMSINEFNRFMEGADDCSKRYECPVIGGNIKDGKSFSVNGTIIGEISKELVLKRTGASEEDVIVVIGDLGMFWTSVIALKYFEKDYDEKEINTFWEKIKLPLPKISAGLLLSEFDAPTSCMDSSDGLTGCFYELCKKNDLDLIIDEELVLQSLSPLTIDIANKFNLDPLKLAFNWGDWQLVCTIPENKYFEFEDLVSDHNSNIATNKNLKKDHIVFHRIGKMSKKRKISKAQVFLQNEEKLMILNNFENERFSNVSYFTHGLINYINFLKDFELLSKYG